ncbi:hypothetical protein RhiJN_07965 [Ceratobasidium sp. AG-Ba]|nr:hypothetical protein RhiJN_07965 [Ceratobasidium sp. AG-Ba]
MSAPMNRSASVNKSGATTTTSRGGSMAPSATSARSQSSAPSKSTSRGQTASDNNHEHFDLDIGYEQTGDEIEEVRTGTSRKKGQKLTKEPKPRPKKGDYNEDPEVQMVIDRAVEETVALLVTDMCCDELDVPIRRGWARAVKFLDLPPGEWLIDQKLTNVCKTLVSGFRLRGRQRFTQAILTHFHLEITPDQDADDVKEIAERLLPMQFHRDPEAIGPNAGHYRNQIMAHRVASIWMSGNKPTATRFPDVLNPVPTLATAYVAALGQDILKRLAKDGCIKIESRSKTDEEREEKARERAAAKARGEAGTRASVDPVRVDMGTHLDNLKLFEERFVSHSRISNIHFQTCLFSKWAGIYKGDSKADDRKAQAAGKLTAASFADELKHAKARRAAAASTSGSDVPPSHGSLAKPRARPVPSSKLPQIKERSEEHPSIGHSRAHHTPPPEFEAPSSPIPQHDSNLRRKNAIPGDEESDDEGHHDQLGNRAKSHVSPRTTPDHESEPEEEGVQEQDDVGEPESTVPGTGKRKSRKETACKDQNDSPSEDDELPKRRKLCKTSGTPAQESDLEEEQIQAEGDVSGNKSGPHAPAMTPTANSPPKANDDPPAGNPMSGDAAPSSPLSESPEVLFAGAKRSTRSSSQVAKDAPLGEVMLTVLEKRKQAEAERRKHTAQKKEEEKEKKAEEAALEELQGQATGAKAANGKTKASAAKKPPKRKK